MGHTHYLCKQKILDYSHNTVPLHRYLLHHIHFYLNRKKYINQNNMHPVGCQNSKVTIEYACYGFKFAELRLFSRASPRYLCFSRAWLALYVIPPVRSIPVFTPYHVYNPCISFPALFSTCIFSCAWYALFVNQRLLLIPYALGLRCTLSHLYAQFQSLRLTTYIILAYPFPHFSLPVSFPAPGMRCLSTNACY